MRSLPNREKEKKQSDHKDLKTIKKVRMFGRKPVEGTVIFNLDLPLGPHCN